MQVRCLLSRADPALKRTKVRETQYSVEAISLDDAQSWIGINQCHVTRYPFEVPPHIYQHDYQCEARASSSHAVA